MFKNNWVNLFDSAVVVASDIDTITKNVTFIKQK